ncbi:MULTISPECIES: VOC family protein [Rhodococcus]|uniref:VOC family protein n=1 Tax=Rhodococcus TaxID=1827 RepID=UPI00027221E2|nr:VOC family protein [Rhodococcus sp. JVH1]EJI98102.1 glyoxalase/Bleomycin resistance protein/Dioxygenase superfamily protein [Rhodococcus sp. JVH1]
MLILGTTVIGARDIGRATRFWTEALGLTALPPVGDNDFTNLTLPDGRPLLAIQQSEHDAEPEPRLHLDLHARDSEDQAAEIERLVGLGARRVPWDRYPEESDFVVLEDTEGNRFCVIDNSRAPEQCRLEMP